MWNPGDRVSHRFNAELGPGLVVEAARRRVRVFFPESGETLIITADSDVLEALVLEPGGRARVEGSGEIVLVAEVNDETARLADGRLMERSDLWPLPVEPSPLQRLKRGQVDAFQDFKNRLDGMRLMQLRQADGLGSFLGGRIRLFPHQLYAASRATAGLMTGEEADTESASAGSSDAETHGVVRWLLADEVGLGKTVEACLIMNHLLHRGQVKRALVVAPETLTLQWLGELWRKYHQMFVYLDSARLKDLAKDHGDDANPFEVHPRSIISLERLRAHPELQRQAVAAGIDLLVVDEAHHLRRPVGERGNDAYRAIQGITELGRHVLLLSATPLEDDAHGFFRLLQLLRPDELTEDTFDERLNREDPLPPCTSSARRVDIGGMPPRTPVPVDMESKGWGILGNMVDELRAQRVKGPELEKKAEQIWRACASVDALAALGDTGPIDSKTLDAARRADPRIPWLVEKAAEWNRAREKVLIFVAHLETLRALREAIEKQARIRVAVFHEELSVERRDVEVAQFRLDDGPNLLISTECGGEGRNFEMCRRLVLFDMPWHPAVVEQRIGRLDRIGRELDTEVVYFRPSTGFGQDLVRLYESIGLFEEPLGGLERELRHIAGRVKEVAMDGPDTAGDDPFAEVLQQARAAADRAREAAYHQLHQDPYTADMADGILAKVPKNLDEVTEDVVMRAAARFGFECEELSGSRTWLIEYGSQALVDHIPGVAHGARFLGTFDRQRAVDNEDLDFFASGHPLVEGILAELEDGSRGRVTIIQVPADEEVFGLLAVYRQGGDLDFVAVDQSGVERPELAKALSDPDLTTEQVDAKQWTSQPSWSRGIKRLIKSLPKREDKPKAVAAFRLRKLKPVTEADS